MNNAASAALAMSVWLSTGLTAVFATAILCLALRQRWIQPEEVVGGYVSEECLNGILTRASRQNNLSEAL